MRHFSASDIYALFTMANEVRVFHTKDVFESSELRPVNSG